MFPFLPMVHPRMSAYLHRIIVSSFSFSIIFLNNMRCPSFSPFWLGDDCVHNGAWRRIEELASRLRKHATIDPFLDHNHTKLGTKEIEETLTANRALELLDAK